MRNQKGITLIALVITIIVLLILAGVSIAMLTGENGILNKATSSRTATNSAEAVERINLALNAVKAEIYDQQSKAGQANWKPITGSEGSYALQSAITTSLSNDGFGTDNGSGKYYYNLTGGVLTLSYYNVTTEVGTSINPIKGTIDLSDAPYEIKAASNS